MIPWHFFWLLGVYSGSSFWWQHLGSFGKRWHHRDEVNLTAGVDLRTSWAKTTHCLVAFRAVWLSCARLGWFCWCNSRRCQGLRFANIIKQLGVLKEQIVMVSIIKNGDSPRAWNDKTRYSPFIWTHVRYTGFTVTRQCGLGDANTGHSVSNRASWRKRTPRVCLGDSVDGWNPANHLRLVVYPTVLFAWLKTISLPLPVVQGFSHPHGLVKILCAKRRGLRWWDVVALAVRIFVVMEEWSGA